MRYEDIIEIVSNIETEIYQQTDGVEYFNITFETNGYVSLVNFLGIQLWNSDDDRREYDEYNNYEPLEQYLRRQINEELYKLSKIKL